MNWYSLPVLLMMVFFAWGEVSASEPLEFGYIILPPFGYTTEEGDVGGYLGDLAKNVLARIGQPTQFQELPAPRLYHQISTGITAMTLGPQGLHQLADHAYESREPVIVLTLSIYRREDTPPVTDVEQLKGKRVVLMQGYSYGKLLRFFESEGDQMELVRARTHKSALNMIKYNRADYLLSYKTALDTVIARLSIDGLKRETISRIPVHFFVSYKVPGARELVRKWDEAFTEMRDADQLPDLNLYLNTD